MSRASHRSARLLLIATLSLSCAAMAQTRPGPSAKNPSATVKSAPKTAPVQSAQKSTAKTDTASTPDQGSAYYHYMMAHYYEQLSATYGRPEYATRAIDEYKQAMRLDPGSRFLEDHLANLYFQTGNIKEAIEAAQEQIKRDPNDLEGHKLLARIYLDSLSNSQQDQQTAQKMLSLATKEYETLVKLDPKSAPDHLMLGRLYAANQQQAKAQAQFEAAQKIDPYSENTVLNLARFYSDSGQTDKAIAILNAVPAGQQTPRMEYALGLTYAHQKKTKEAVTALERALVLDPGNLDIEKALAKNLFADQQYDKALPYYQDIAAADPKDSTAFLRLSDIERHKGEFQKSYDNLMKAKTLSPESIEIAYDEGLLNDALGHLNKAAANFQKLVQISDRPSSDFSKDEKTDRFLFLDRLAHVYREQNKVDEAIAVYEKMIDLGGKFTEQAYQSQVDTYDSAHEYAKARNAAEQAAKGLPHSRSMKILLAATMADTGDARQAIAMDKSLLDGKPDDDRQVYLALAQMQIRLGHWRDANKALNQAEKLAKTDDQKVFIYFLRGSLLERQNRLDAAEAQARKVLALEPENPVALNYLGYLLANRGKDLPRALALIQRAVKLDPMNYAYLDSLGWAYFKLGNYAEAEKNLRQACDRDSTDPTVHDHLGQLYAKMGQLKLAAEQWELSLKEFAHTLPADAEPGEQARVQKQLDQVRIRLAKESPAPRQP
ncbi:MAG: tetratricopeptide repeat protein [Acidobacteriaceae bacterium]